MVVIMRLSAGLLADSSQKPVGTGSFIDTPPMIVSDAMATVAALASAATKARRLSIATSREEEPGAVSVAESSLAPRCR
jgi:hypothetical protein